MVPFAGALPVAAVLAARRRRKEPELGGAPRLMCSAGAVLPWPYDTNLVR